MALLLAALIFVQHADASATEHEGGLLRATFLQPADEVLRLAATATVPEETNLFVGARLA